MPARPGIRGLIGWHREGKARPGHGRVRQRVPGGAPAKAWQCEGRLDQEWRVWGSSVSSRGWTGLSLHQGPGPGTQVPEGPWCPQAFSLPQVHFGSLCNLSILS